LGQPSVIAKTCRQPNGKLFAITPRPRASSAVYLVLPAIYCDVTRSWLLPRRQWVVVAVAGMLFEAAVGAIFSAVGVI